MCFILIKIEYNIINLLLEIKKNKNKNRQNILLKFYEAIKNINNNFSNPALSFLLYTY